MSEIIELIKQLRDRTGAGLMDCKKALLENDNDVEKAAVWLREKGIAKQAKKASTRIAADGKAWVKVDGNKAVVYEVNSETDFVANSDPFKELVSKIGDIILKHEPHTMEEALASQDDDGKSINDMFIDAGIKLGEKLSFRRFIVCHKTDKQIFGPYVHLKGKIATLSVIEGGDDELALNVSLNVCSNNPAYVTFEDIPEEIIAKESEIAKETFANDPSFAKKPDEIKERILAGKVKNSLVDQVLVEGPFVLDDSKTIGQLLKEKNAKVVHFFRYAVGEGIEKKEEDFAKEVQSQIK